MDFYPIRKVTISCPACNAGIKLDITSKDNTAMEKLIAESEDFVCPVCKAKLSGANKVLQCTNTYNMTVAMLKQSQQLFNVEFE